ncbi:MAG: hypothetical protein WAW37_00075 [Syntrophobacteraceae bacterium]
MSQTSRFADDSIELRLAATLRDLINERSPNGNPIIPEKTDMQKWAGHIDRMIQLDGRSPDEVGEVIRWAQQDTFWRNNIHSTAKLRQRFGQLFDLMNSKQVGRKEPANASARVIDPARQGFDALPLGERQERNARVNEEHPGLADISPSAVEAVAAAAWHEEVSRHA